MYTGIASSLALHLLLTIIYEVEILWEKLASECIHNIILASNIVSISGGNQFLSSLDTLYTTSQLVIRSRAKFLRATP